MYQSSAIVELKHSSSYAEFQCWFNRICLLLRSQGVEGVLLNYEHYSSLTVKKESIVQEVASAANYETSFADSDTK
jgi:hypothetical protein